ncbi:unnamed protein product [Rotaria magnacalcarata]|uniref:Uncharacterized protein n=1 Tax=Rotaria magnacalcarata TaxID=392030 RepID=A0A816T229_9BILA|nr:unnamed protein product [Rotaria magnacalcarata]
MFSPYIVISNAVQPERPIILTTESIDWTGQLNADDTSHKIGIYKAITYANEMTLKGRFSGYGGYNVGSLGQAKMLLQLSDMRGMDGQPALTINGSKRQLFNFASPSQNSFLGMGQAEVTLTPEDIQQGFNFEIRAKVNGLSSIELIPFAKNNTVNLQSKWPSPSYFGSALPNQKYATKGFNASWSNPFLANENATLLKDCLTNQISDACGALNNNARGYGVKLINGIDAYQMLQRTIKYALLFLTITFCAFFLFETLQDLRIHPIQYTLFESSQDQEPSLKKLMVSALPEFELKHKALTQWSKNDVSHFYANSNQTIVSLGSLLLASHEGLGFDFNRQRLLQKLILFSA